MTALGLLGIILVVLKALGLISLSWLWVTAPFWAPLVLTILFYAFLIAVSAVAAILK